MKTPLPSVLVRQLGADARSEFYIYDLAVAAEHRRQGPVGFCDAFGWIAWRQELGEDEDQIRIRP